MSEQEGLDPRLAELFQKEPMPGLPELARARLLGRIEAAVPAIGVALPSAKASLPRVGVPVAKAIALATAAFVAGGIATGVALSALRPLPAPRIVYVERPAPSSPPAASVDSPPSPIEMPSAPPFRALDARAAPTASSSGETLSAERVLIDAARTKLSSGEPSAALARVQDHARRFPHGRLEEEREALAVEALVQSGQYDAARDRAAQLQGRWPDSLFLPAVKTTIESIP